MEECIYMLSADDEDGDHWMFITNNADRLPRAFAELSERYGTVTGNEEAMKLLRLQVGEQSH